MCPADIAAVKHFRQKLRKLVDIVGSENQIHKAIAFFDFFNHGKLLHHTAAKSHLHVMVFLFQAVDVAQAAINSLVGIVPYGTGIVNNKIRVFVLRRQITDAFKNPGQLFRIPGIHLTPESYHRRSKRTPQAFALRFHIPAAFCHKIVLTGRFVFRRLRIYIYFI